MAELDRARSEASVDAVGVELLDCGRREGLHRDRSEGGSEMLADGQRVVLQRGCRDLVPGDGIEPAGQ
jgi:hypothetical protein